MTAPSQPFPLRQSHSPEHQRPLSSREAPTGSYNHNAYVNSTRQIGTVYAGQRTMLMRAAMESTAAAVAVVDQ